MDEDMKKEVNDMNSFNARTYLMDLYEKYNDKNDPLGTIRKHMMQILGDDMDLDVQFESSDNTVVIKATRKPCIAVPTISGS